MNQFFLHYTELQDLTNPFRMFSASYFIILIIGVLYIIGMLKVYKKKDEADKKKIIQIFGAGFLIEETIFIIWNLLMCKENAWLEVLPLHLCSLCAYMNAISAFTNWKKAKAFSAVIGFFSGLIAVVYPANVLDIYPVFSYRVLNFFLLHFSFIVYSLFLFQEKDTREYRFIFSNTIMLTLLMIVAVFVNYHFHTDYMFVGVPPQIGILQIFYVMLGKMLFYITFITALVLVQFIVVGCVRYVYCKWIRI